MYEDIGDVSQGLIDELLLTINFVEWVHYKDSSRDYWTYHPKERCPDLPFKDVRGAFFLKICPGGKIARHTDNERDDMTFHHIPVLTNDKAVCFSFEDGQEVAKHLHVGRLYTADRTFEHWSSNEGDTDRIHLLVPAYED